MALADMFSNRLPGGFPGIGSVTNFEVGPRMGGGDWEWKSVPLELLIAALCTPARGLQLL